MRMEFDRLPEFSPLRLPDAASSTNPVQVLLDNLGVPWRTPTRELIERLGIAEHPAYDWDVIRIPGEEAPLPGMIFPLAANAFRVSSVAPPDYFFTSVWIGDDPLANLACAAEFLSGRLGPAQVGRSGNTLACEWVAGPASIKLASWPPALQRFRTWNPSHDRDARLRTACSVSIHPGFRRTLSAQERARLETVSVLMPVRSSGAADSVSALRRSRPLPTTAEFAREPADECAGLLGMIGVSQDGEALVVCARELLVIPTRRVLRVGVSKLSRAKGPGGSRLELICSDEASAGGETAVPLGEGTDPDELDSAARRLGERLGSPVDIGIALPDC